MAPTRRDMLKLSAGAALALPFAAGATVKPTPAQSSEPIDIETGIIARPAKIGGCIYLHVDDRAASGSEPISTVVEVTGFLQPDGTWRVALAEPPGWNTSEQKPKFSEVSHATWPEIIDTAFSITGVVRE